MSAVSEDRPPDAVARGAAGASIASWRAAFKALVRSFWPGADEIWLSTAELQLYRRGMRYFAPVITIAGFGISRCCAAWIGWQTRTAWWVAVALVAFALQATSIHLKRKPATSRDEIRLWAAWQIASIVVFLTVWCSMSVFLWAPGAQVNHMLLAFLLAVSLAGSIPLSAVRLANSMTVIFVHAVFLIGPLILSTLDLDHTIAWLAATFVIVMGVQAVALHDSIRRTLTLEHERTDVVESLRMAKQESDRERSRAAAAGRAKSQFLSNMNHELRTPMNAILGFSELIKQKAFGAAIDKYVEYAEIIHLSGQNLLTLIDDMLDLAKIEAGKLSLRECEVDLALLMSDLFDEYEGKAAEAKLSLLRKVSPGLPRVLADERAIRQVIANLASNALKFTPAEGCVTLFARLDGDGRIAFGVDDTGIGIADDVQHEIFDRFGVGRHDVSTLDKGTGLGLAIVKGFIEAHDGEVKLESTLGAGTRVTAYLPAERMCIEPVRKTG